MHSQFNPIRLEDPPPRGARVLHHISRSPFAILFLVSACLMLPVWWFGFPMGGHDTLTHIRWQQVFADQFWSGELYPRWLATMNEGLGSPGFFIYPPLPHFLAALLAPFSSTEAWAQQRLGIMATLGFFASGAGAYLWLLQVTRDRLSALLGAIVFLASPYHLLIDTYNRAAYAELWAFTFAPFSLWAIHLFDKKPARAVCIYTLATAALFMSHAPSCMTLAPSYIAYAALLSFLARRKDILLWTCASSLAAVALAGSYLATALTHQGFINFAALYSDYFEFSRWLLLAEQRWPRPSTEMGVAGVSIVQYGLVFVLGWQLLRAKALAPMQRALTLLCVVGSLVFLFLMTVFSMPLWALFPIAQKIQFPWRLLTTQTVFMALIAALYAHWAGLHDAAAPRPPGRRLRLPMLLVLLVLMATNIGLIAFLRPDFTSAPPPGTRDVPEYQLGNLERASALFAPGSDVRLLAGQGSATLETISPRHLRLRTETDTEVRAIVRQFFYPGWECVGAGRRATCTVEPFNPDTPVLLVTASAGQGAIDIVLTKTGTERGGEFISLAGLLLMAALCTGAAFRRKRHTQ